MVQEYMQCMLVGRNRYSRHRNMGSMASTSSPQEQKIELKW